MEKVEKTLYIEDKPVKLVREWCSTGGDYQFIEYVSQSDQKHVIPWKVSNQEASPFKKKEQLDEDFPELQRTPLRQSMQGHKDNKSKTQRGKKSGLRVRFELDVKNTGQPSVTTKSQSAVTTKSQSAVEPKEESAEDLKSQPEVTSKPQPAITDDKPLFSWFQQTAARSASAGTDLCLNQTKQSLIQISELDFHSNIMRKDDKISRLSQENSALLKEVEQLKELLKNQTSKAEQEVTVCVEHQSSQWEEERSCLVNEHLTAISNMKAMWIQDLKNERSQWEREKSRLTAMHQQEISKLKAMWIQDMEKERSQSEEVKSCLTAEYKQEISKLKAMWAEYLKKQKSQWEEENSYIKDEHQEEISKLKSMWVQDLDKERSQWEGEKSCLTAEHQQEISKLKSMWVQDLEKERSQWEDEKSCLTDKHQQEISKLKSMWVQDLEKERSLSEGEKSCLAAEHVQEISKMKAMWIQELNEKMSRWKKEEIRLLAEHLDETSILKSRVMKVQDDLEKERLQWHEEKSFLLESIVNLKRVKDKKQEEKPKSTDELLDKLVPQMEEIGNKTKKKKSIKKQFLQLFKKTGKDAARSNI